MSVAQQLDQRLRTRYKLGVGKLPDVFAQASVGLSDWKCGEEADSVIRRADLALKSKNARREHTPTNPPDSARHGRC